jgi:hypothetical protein
MPRPRGTPAEVVMRSFMALNGEDQGKVLFAINAVRSAAPLTPLEVQRVISNVESAKKRRKKGAATADVPVE